jgi:hypothetical protein
MTVTSIGAASQPLQPQRGDLRSRTEQAMGSVAQLFGESSDQLVNELSSGRTSLSELAKSKGISQADLTNAIHQGLQQASGSSGTKLSDTQLTNLTNRIANHVHGGHHHHAGGAKGAAGASVVSAIAPSKVGTDADGDNDGTTAAATAASSGDPAADVPNRSQGVDQFM